MSTPKHGRKSTPIPIGASPRSRCAPPRHMHGDPLCWLRVFVCVTLYAADEGVFFCFWYPLPLGVRLGTSKRAKKAGDAMWPFIARGSFLLLCCCCCCLCDMLCRFLPGANEEVAAKKPALQLFPGGYRPETDISAVLFCVVSGRVHSFGTHPCLFLTK